MAGKSNLPFGIPNVISRTTIVSLFVGLPKSFFIKKLLFINFIPITL